MTVVTVAYNSEAVLPDMLSALPQTVAVIVVDNGSTNPEAVARIARETGVTLVRSDTNLGFGRGCNLGAKAAETKFLLFLNPDTVPEPKAIDALLSAARTYPKAAAFNPRIFTRTGRQTLKRRSRLIPRKDWGRGPLPQSDVELPTLSGAALFVRKRDFDDVGGFDPDIFLYHEDDDLSVRLAERIGPLMLVHDARVTHLEGRSVVRTPQSAAFKARAMGQSLVHVLRKHGRPSPEIHALGVAVLGLVTPLNLLSSRKRAKSVAFFRGVLDAVRGQKPAGPIEGTAATREQIDG
ncbi:MAG: glycosyltransferase family 2 protein, partial [Pseudomonadota bacterium]